MSGEKIPFLISQDKMPRIFITDWETASYCPYLRASFIPGGFSHSHA